MERLWLVGETVEATTGLNYFYFGYGISSKLFFDKIGQILWAFWNLYALYIVYLILLLSPQCDIILVLHPALSPVSGLVIVIWASLFKRIEIFCKSFLEGPH